MSHGRFVGRTREMIALPCPTFSAPGNRWSAGLTSRRRPDYPGLSCRLPPPSSRGPGHRLFKPATGVRIPVGAFSAPREPPPQAVPAHDCTGPADARFLRAARTGVAGRPLLPLVYARRACARGAGAVYRQIRGLDESGRVRVNFWDEHGKCTKRLSSGGCLTRPASPALKTYPRTLGDRPPGRSFPSIRPVMG
jgi:hypothetical protein